VAKAVGLADWEVNLAGSGQAVISSADLKVDLADSELEGSPPFVAYRGLISINDAVINR
jgi:hypothetical protein